MSPTPGSGPASARVTRTICTERSAAAGRHLSASPVAAMRLRPAVLACTLACLLPLSAGALPVPTQPVRPLPAEGAGAGGAAASSMQQAVAALKAGKTEEAQKALQAALRANPKQIEALMGLAELSYKARKDSDTLKWLQQAERVDPQRADVQLALGRFYLERQQQADKGEAALRKAISLDPKLVPARLSLAQSLSGRGAHAEALPVLQELQKQDPKNAAAAYAIGVVQLRLGARAEAEQQLRKAGELDPKNPSPWMALARSLPDRKAAQAALDQALQRKPDNAEALLLRAGWQQQDKDLKGARDSLQRAAKADTKLADPLVQLGLIEESEGRRSEARRHYMTAIERDPHHPVALNNLVMMGLADNEDPGRLELMARRAVKALPDNAMVYDTLALALRARKDKKGALAASEQAVKLAPKEASLRLNLAEIQHWNGDRTGARKSAEQVLALQASGKDADKAKALLARL